MLFEHNKNLSLYSASVQEPLIYSSPFNSINFLNKKTTLESKTQDEDKKLSKNPNVIRTIKNKKIVYCQADKSKNPPSTGNDSNYELSLTNTNNNSKDYSDCTACISNNDVNMEENETKDIEKIAEDKTKRGKRGSKYRGVSKNGNQWQVLIMVNKKKRYIGNYKTEDEAASSYDIVAIQNHGKKAKTNFYYTPEEIQKIRQDKKITWRS